MVLSEKIKERAFQLGFDLIGISPVKPLVHGDFLVDWLARGFAGEMGYLRRNLEKRLDPSKVLPGARSIISVAKSYYIPVKGMINKDGPTGRVARYAWGKDYHELIGDRLEELLSFIVSQTDKKVGGKVYVDTGPLLERELASLAGIGWIGKNTNLINRKFGSWLVLGEILLNITLDYDGPTPIFCGTCTRCIDACPTGALVAPYLLDSRLCISYMTIELKGSIPVELRQQIGNHIFGCDICQEVCPWNRKAHPTSEAVFEPRDDLSDPELFPIMRLSEHEFQVRFKQSSIKRAKRRGLLRNVAIALGNSRDPKIVPILIQALQDNESLVRTHAAWALRRIGTTRALTALKQALKAENDPEVVAEIQNALGWT